MIKHVTFVSRGIPTAGNPLNGIFEFDQAKAIAAYRTDITVSFIALDFNKDSRGRIGLNTYTREGVRVYHLLLPTGVYRRGLPVLKFLLRRVYCKVVKDLGMPDVIHSHFYFIGALCETLRRYKVPIVHTEHSSKLNKDLSQISALDQSLARAAYRAGDKIITVSHALQKRLKDNFSADSVIVPNIVDTEAFECEQHEPHEGFRFVSTGRLIAAKGFDKLIDCFASANFDNNVSLSIIGDGAEKANLQQLIESKGVADRVKLLGQLDRKSIAEVYKHADAFVLLSDSETFGVAYIEAMSSGLPVISSRCGGPEDFIDDDCGRLVNADDKAEVVSSLENFASGSLSFDHKAIATAARNKFSPAAVAAKVVDVYCFVSR